MVVGGEGDEIERNFQAKMRLEPRNREEAAQRISIAFRAPQENFTIRDFELGKVLGVGSHSKVLPFLLFLRLCDKFVFLCYYL